MASRPLMIATLVGASVGVPYIASNAQKGQVSSGTAVPAVHHGAVPPAVPQFAAATTAAPSHASMIQSAQYPSTTPRNDLTPITPVNQVLRFDVTKDWVNRTWPRKTVAPTDVGLTSVRVPLVTGTQLSSLAGSLTYFFNAQGQVEHISFRGRTGDALQLIQLLTQHYQFQRVDVGVGEQVYQVRSGEGVQSELRLQTGGVIRSDTPQQNVAVELEFARPGSSRYLPNRGPTLQVPTDSSAAAATPSPPVSSSQGATDSIKSAASSYWDRIHYATPEEKAPAQWKRWPD